MIEMSDVTNAIYMYKYISPFVWIAGAQRRFCVRAV